MKLAKNYPANKSKTEMQTQVHLELSPSHHDTSSRAVVGF